MRRALAAAVVVAFVAAAATASALQPSKIAASATVDAIASRNSSNVKSANLVIQKLGP